MKNGLENIDEIFKQAFDGFESNVDPSVWNNIQNTISSGTGGGNTTPKVDPSSATGIIGKSLALKFVAGVVLIGTVATATYLVLTSEKENELTENVVSTNKVTETTLIDIKPVVEEPNAINEEKVTSSQPTQVEKNSNIETNLVEEKSNDNPVLEHAPKTEIKVTSNTSNNIVVSDNNSKKDDNNEKTQDSNSDFSNTDTKIENESDKNSIEPESTEKSVTQTEEFKIVIPNVITPNGDGMNDVIKIPSENIEKLEIVVMDKTGKPLFTFKTIEDIFEGKDQSGFKLSPGVYYVAGVIVDNKGNPHAVKQTINLLK